MARQQMRSDSRFFCPGKSTTARNLEIPSPAMPGPAQPARPVPAMPSPARKAPPCHTRPHKNRPVSPALGQKPHHGPPESTRPRLCQHNSPAQRSFHAPTVRAARPYSKAPLLNLPVPVKVSVPVPVHIPDPISVLVNTCQSSRLHETNAALQPGPIPARPGKPHLSTSS